MQDTTQGIMQGMKVHVVGTVPLVPTFLHFLVWVTFFHLGVIPATFQQNALLPPANEVLGQGNIFKSVYQEFCSQGGGGGGGIPACIAGGIPACLASFQVHT